MDAPKITDDFGVLNLLYYFSFLLSPSVRGLRHEPGHHADVPVRTPGRLQDLLRQDDPGRRRRQEIAVEVSAESPGRSVPSLMLSYLLP